MNALIWSEEASHHLVHTKLALNIPSEKTNNTINTKISAIPNDGTVPFQINEGFISIMARTATVNPSPIKVETNKRTIDTLIKLYRLQQLSANSPNTG